MKRLLLLIPLALLIMAPGPQVGGWGFGGNPRPSGGSLAFFEFAPASGAGMGSACACTTPTGAKGEALTFTRTSSATCTKTSSGGLATSGIANGDLVTCSSGQPRVEYDSAGYLGLLVESSRQNRILRSEEINNAAWTKGAGVTITPDYAVAPDGNTTAERLQYTNTNGDYVLQGFSVGGLAASVSVYLKGTSGSGTIYLCRGGAASQCVTCSYVSTSWSRCRYEATLATSSNAFLGCDTGTLGGACAQTGFDVLVWGFQGELGAYATSYIPTTSAAATRQAESATITLSPGIGPNFSMASSVVWPSSDVGAVNFFFLGTAGAGNNAGLYRNSNTAAGFEIGVTVTTPAVSAMGTAQQRGALADASGTRSAFWNGASVSAPAASLSGAQTVVNIGAGPASAVPANGIVSRACIDPDPTRCR